MARTAADLPAGMRLTDHLSLGVLTAQFPMELVEQVLFETERFSERERMALRVTARFAQRLGTMAPIQVACTGNRFETGVSWPVLLSSAAGGALASSPFRCNAKCSVLATTLPARTA